MIWPPPSNEPPPVLRGLMARGVIVRARRKSCCRFRCTAPGVWSMPGRVAVYCDTHIREVLR